MLSGCDTLQRTQPVRFVVLRLVSSMRKSMAAAGVGMLLLVVLLLAAMVIVLGVVFLRQVRLVCLQAANGRAMKLLSIQ